MIVRTIVAHCDAIDDLGEGHVRHCFASVSLGSDTTQPFVDLTKLGWTTRIVGEGAKSQIKTVCPNHTGEPSVRD